MSATPFTTQAVISLGTNIESRERRLADAREAIATLPHTRLVKLSSIGSAMYPASTCIFCMPLTGMGFVTSFSTVTAT